MRWARVVVIAAGLSLPAVVLTAQEPAANAGQGTAAKPEERQPSKDPSKDAAKATGPARAEASGDKAEGKTEDKAPEAKTDNKPTAKAEGPAEAKTSESEAQNNTEGKREPGASAEADAGVDRKSNQDATGGDAANAVSEKGEAGSTKTKDAVGDGATSPGNGATDAAQPVPQKRPRKIVVREGGASEPSTQIVTGMPVAEANQQRQETEKLMDAAEEDMKRVMGRILDAQQQETVSQVHNYVERARAALKEGDISRGHTLALKADLLADDLVKH